MSVFSLLLLPAVLAPQGHDYAARLEALGEVRTVRFEGVRLEKESARAWKDLLAAVRRHAPELHGRFLEAFQGALLASGAEAGIWWSAERKRLELQLPEAALAFTREEAGGLPAARSFLERALAARRQWLERAGGPEASPEDRRRAALAVHGLAAEAELDGLLWRERKERGLGVLPRRRTGRPEDREADGSLGIPVAWGGVVLVGEPAWLQRAREILSGLRADPAARDLLDRYVEIVFPAPSSFVTADWYFWSKDVAVRLGTQAAGSPAAILALGLEDRVNGRSVALPGAPRLDQRVLQANVAGMAAYWRLLRESKKGPPGEEEIQAAMAAARSAFLKDRRAGS